MTVSSGSFEFVCLGDVNKGLPEAKIRDMFGIPADIILSLGLPKEHKGKNSRELSFSIFYGVYIRKSDFLAYEKNQVNIRPRRFLNSILLLVLILILVGMSSTFIWWQWLIVTPCLITLLFLVKKRSKAKKK